MSSIEEVIEQMAQTMKPVYCDCEVGRCKTTTLTKGRCANVYAPGIAEQAAAIRGLVASNTRWREYVAALEKYAGPSAVAGIKDDLDWQEDHPHGK